MTSRAQRGEHPLRPRPIAGSRARVAEIRQEMRAVSSEARCGLELRDRTTRLSDLEIGAAEHKAAQRGIRVELECPVRRGDGNVIRSRLELYVRNQRGGRNGQRIAAMCRVYFRSRFVVTSKNGQQLREPIVRDGVLRIERNRTLIR